MGARRMKAPPAPSIREVRAWLYETETVLRTLERMSEASATQAPEWKDNTMRHYRERFNSLMSACPDGAELSKRAYLDRYSRV